MASNKDILGKLKGFLGSDENADMKELLEKLVDTAASSRGPQLLNLFGAGKDILQDPVGGATRLLRSKVRDAEQRLIPLQRGALRGIREFDRAFLGASSDQMSLSRMAWGNILGGGSRQWSTSTSTAAVNKELASREFSRTVTEGIGKLAYRGLESIPLGGYLGRASGVEAAVFNKFQIERDMEGFSRNLSRNITGSRTSVFGRGFKPGSFTQSAGRDPLLRAEMQLQRDFGYSAKQLEEMRRTAMGTFDQGSLERNVKDELGSPDGQGKDAEVVMQELVASSTRAVSSVMRGLNMTTQQIKEMTKGFKAFGVDMSKDLLSTAASIKQASNASGMSNEALSRIMAAGGAYGAQNYLGGKATSQSFLRQAVGVGQDLRIDKGMATILGRYGGANAQGIQNYLATRNQAGANFMESGLGMVSRIATGAAGEGSFRAFSRGNASVFDLINAGAAGIGANAFSALGASVNESARGEVASSGIDASITMANNLFKQTLGGSVTGKQNIIGAKASILSQMTGMTVNQSADEIRRREAEQINVESARVGGVVAHTKRLNRRSSGEDWQKALKGMSKDKFFSLMKKRAARTGNSVSYEAEAFEKRQGRGTTYRDLEDEIVKGRTSEEADLYSKLYDAEYMKRGRNKDYDNLLSTGEIAKSLTYGSVEEADKRVQMRTFSNAVGAQIGEPGVANLKSILRKGMKNLYSGDTSEDDIDLRQLVNYDKLSKKGDLRKKLLEAGYSKSKATRITEMVGFLKTKKDGSITVDEDKAKAKLKGLSEEKILEYGERYGLSKGQLKKLKDAGDDDDEALLIKMMDKKKMTTKLFGDVLNIKGEIKAARGHTAANPLFVQLVDDSKTYKSS